MKNAEETLRHSCQAASLDCAGSCWRVAKLSTSELIGIIGAHCQRCATFTIFDIGDPGGSLVLTTYIVDPIQYCLE